MKRLFAFQIVALLALAAGARLGAAEAPPAEGNSGYYRFPAVHGDLVVFTAEGDLWRVGINGGSAQRLTSHPAEESHPAFSPDGKTLAFSAQYEGPLEVYTMPVDGGRPFAAPSKAGPPSSWAGRLTAGESSMRHAISRRCRTFKWPLWT